MAESTIRLNLDLTPAHAALLTSAHLENFYLEQPERFQEAIDGPAGWRADPKFVHGSFLFVLGKFAEALMVEAYERGNGYATVLLWDTDQQQFVIASTRPWTHGEA